MPCVIANLAMMFVEVAVLDRFAAAFAERFDAVKILLPPEHEPDEISAVPHSDEPGPGGSVNFHMRREMDATGHTGFPGSEYRSVADTVARLASGL